MRLRHRPTGIVVVSLGADEASKIETVPSSLLVTTSNVGRLAGVGSAASVPVAENGTMATARRQVRNTMFLILASASWRRSVFAVDREEREGCGS